MKLKVEDMDLITPRNNLRKKNSKNSKKLIRNTDKILKLQRK